MEKIELPKNFPYQNLDAGEKEAIALAISKKALVLMDEEQGREAARKELVTVKGTIGVLMLLSSER